MNDTFYVGGHEVVGPDGTHTLVGQMYVQRIGDGDLLPVVMVHGGTQSGAHWERTPDGRPGLAPLLAAHGRPTYVVDLPGVGRSLYHPDHHGPLVHYTAEMTEYVFTAPPPGAWPGAGLHTQWPGTGRRGDPVFDALTAGQVGRLADEATAESSARDALAALIDRIGPCHVLTHSQGGAYGWHAADARPDRVRSIIALEPKGPPWFDPQAAAHDRPPRPYGLTSRPLDYDPPLAPGEPLPFTLDAEGTVRQPAPPRALAGLRQVPVLLLTGEASYHDTYDGLTAAFLREAGVIVEHVRLAERGIHGNGHLLALELNNDQIADLIESWLSTTT
jgi:pimeloyl-ACP methyl ester carboxylesterase